MPEQEVKSRISMKHDTESNWADSTLIPKAGEIIFYDPDDNYNYTRMKIGDGSSLAESLPFFEEGMKQNLLNMMHPVGSLYLSVTNVSPAVLFGGTWEQIEDTFLLAAGDTYSAGTTGGEAKHTLTYKELPATTGSIIMHNASYGTNVAGVGGCFTASYVNDGIYRHGGTLLEASTSSVGKINYSNGGADQAHNNMPPYLAVYVWKRIA